MLQIYSDSISSIFTVQKVRFANTQDLTLPTNKKSLKNFYLDIIDVLNEVTLYNLDYGEEIQKNELIGRRFTHKDLDDKFTCEAHIFYINRSFYTFFYFDENGLNSDDKNRFFNSIIFNDDYELHQFPVKKCRSLKRYL